ncbi:hypothetical protein LCGC14_1098900 [marine sediment metagenome]|uniref:Uncharacterized protein n=1 Tax=marine sediment metagenome TaxID=412755 RepID=A0A0F9MY10_9ZZZZ
MLCRIDPTGTAIEPTHGIERMIIYLDVSHLGPPVVSIYCPVCGEHTKRLLAPDLRFEVRHESTCRLVSVS